jgi:hypothetical protein
MPNKGEPTAPVQTEAPTLRNPEVDRVTVRVPPFWSNEPALWFSQLESQLALANVTADTTKFHYVVSNLDFRNTQVVRDNLQTLPRTDKYEALKTALISHPVAARNIFGWVGRHFNVIITFFIMFVVIAGKECLC